MLAPAVSTWAVWVAWECVGVSSVNNTFCKHLRGPDLITSAFSLNGVYSVNSVSVRDYVQLCVLSGLHCDFLIMCVCLCVCSSERE